MSHPRNIAGPIIRKVRTATGLTQPQLAAKCNLLGWNISRETLAKVETQVRWISDAELLCLAKALGVPVEALLADHLREPRALAKFFRSVHP